MTRREEKEARAKARSVRISGELPPASAPRPPSEPPQTAPQPQYRPIPELDNHHGQEAAE
jgi:hypothetical protein